MSKSFDADVEALRAELRKKGHDLLLAARYGKGLLEENNQYKKDLESAQQECTTLREALEAQKHESQKALAESRRVAEIHVTELEQQLDGLRSSLEKEQSATASVKEEYQRLLNQLKAENAQLKEELDKATEDKQLLDNQLQQVNLKLNESEGQKMKLMQEIKELQTQVNSLKQSNGSLEESVGTLVHTCDQLSDELENSREEVEDLENRCKCEKEELMSTLKELEDTQDQLKQLQIQFEQQSMAVLTPNESINSRMSLYDELYSSRNSSFDNGLAENDPNQEEMLSIYSDSDAPDSFCGELSPILLRKETELTLAPSPPSSSPLPGWTDDQQCPRCKDLEKQLKESKEESENVAKQLIIAVQQKYKLQEQIEAWQLDMAQMIEKQVHAKLKHQGGKRGKNSKTKHNDNKSSEPGIAYHLAKHPFSVF